METPRSIDEKLRERGEEALALKLNAHFNSVRQLMRGSSAHAKHSQGIVKYTVYRSLIDKESIWPEQALDIQSALDFAKRGIFDALKADAGQKEVDDFMRQVDALTAQVEDIANIVNR